jgi:hypothetical protein
MVELIACVHANTITIAFIITPTIVSLITTIVTNMIIVPIKSMINPIVVATITAISQVHMEWLWVGDRVC